MRAMRDNGSPPAEFEFDEDHGHFVVRLRVQPDAPQIDLSGGGPVTLPVTPPVTPPVGTILESLGDRGELGNAEIRERLRLKDRTHLRQHYIEPALTSGLIEYTIPDKPNSRLQKYRLTQKGRIWLASKLNRNHAD